MENAFDQVNEEQILPTVVDDYASTHDSEVELFQKLQRRPAPKPPLQLITQWKLWVVPSVTSIISLALLIGICVIMEVNNWEDAETSLVNMLILVGTFTLMMLTAIVPMHFFEKAGAKRTKIFQQSPEYQEWQLAQSIDFQELKIIKHNDGVQICVQEPDGKQKSEKTFAPEEMEAAIAYREELKHLMHETNAQRIATARAEEPHRLEREEQIQEFHELLTHNV